MSYPLPIKYESAKSLYKQAMFFYKEYERKKKENAKLRARIEWLEEHGTEWDAPLSDAPGAQEYHCMDPCQNCVQPHGYLQKVGCRHRNKTPHTNKRD